MNVRLRNIILILTAGAIISGCDALGGQRTGPDEFAVVTRAPLSLPPDYGLRPPRPGAERPNETSPRTEAQQKLLKNLGNRTGRAKNLTPDTKGKFTNGEAALLKRAEALDVDPEIRYLVERESGRISEDDSLVDTLVFWREKPKGQTLVDPKKEAERLRGNAALGKPPTEGTTPIVEK